MIKQFNRQTIKVKGKEIDCLILGRYENYRKADYIWKVLLRQWGVK